MQIEAKFYDGMSSKEQIVKVEFTKDKRLKIDSLGIDLPLQDVTISSRLGSTPRVIQLPNGGRLKSIENDKIDSILKELNIFQSKIHKIENSWKIAVASIVLIAAFVVFMLTAGANYSAKFLADILPENSLDYVSKEALKQLDKEVLSKSNLTKEKKVKILALFHRLTRGDSRYKLHFRSSPKIGPNAFALPSGDIVLLDELVFLDRDKELRGVLGVLAHEKGHVVYKHGLQGVIKGAIATTIIGYFTGDFSFIATTLPTIIVTSSYSREFETQADIYAKEELKRLHTSTKPLAKLFKSLDRYFKKRSSDNNFTKYLDWISTHPATKKRVDFFLKD